MTRGALLIFLAALWFGLSGYMFLNPGFARIGPTAAWLALLMGFFNLGRWLMIRKTVSQPSLQRQRRESEPYDGPNPDFDFDLRTKEME